MSNVFVKKEELEEILKKLRTEFYLVSRGIVEFTRNAHADPVLWNKKDTGMPTSTKANYLNYVYQLKECEIYLKKAQGQLQKAKDAKNRVDEVEMERLIEPIEKRKALLEAALDIWARDGSYWSDVPWFKQFGLTKEEIEDQGLDNAVIMVEGARKEQEGGGGNPIDTLLGLEGQRTQAAQQGTYRFAGQPKPSEAEKQPEQAKSDEKAKNKRSRGGNKK